LIMLEKRMEVSIRSDYADHTACARQIPPGEDYIRESDEELPIADWKRNRKSEIRKGRCLGSDFCFLPSAFSSNRQSSIPGDVRHKPE